MPARILFIVSRKDATFAVRLPFHSQSLAMAERDSCLVVMFVSPETTGLLLARVRSQDMKNIGSGLL